MVVGGIAIATAVVAAGGVLTVVASQPPDAVVLSAASHGHHETSGPVIEVPLNGVDGVVSTQRPEAMPTTTTSAGTEPPVPTSTKRGEAKTVVVTSPPLGGSGGLGITEEAKSDLPTVSTPLPATLALPSGATLTHDPSKYPNGVLEWLFTNPSTSYESAVAFMQGALTRNGWSITAQPPVFTYPDPDPAVAPIRSQRFYVANGAVRGYVIVSSRGKLPGSGFQIDLLGL
jgi:hypothetical protein